MSSENIEYNAKDTEVLFVGSDKESSEDPPMDEWSSLLIDVRASETRSHGNYEMCTDYIPMSASSILRHLYYNYPSVKDPGIVKALQDPPEQIVYPYDGQDLYLSECKSMNICPVMSFYRGLLSEIINLKYYCVDSYAVRPMAFALKNNRFVTVLDFTDNFLNEDSCFHLGDMLKTNTVLRELILAGCKIGALGAKKIFAGLKENKTLVLINLNRNGIGDMGIEYFAEVIFGGVYVHEVLLRHNNINGKFYSLVEAFEAHNEFTRLDLSWNNLYSPGATNYLITILGDNNLLQDLNLSWNSLSSTRIAVAIKYLFNAKNLRHLDLSHNNFFGLAITTILENLKKAKKLITLNLSYNPLTPVDALRVLVKLKLPAVKVQNVLMENIFVDGKFLKLLTKVKSLKFRKNTVITYGGVIGGYKFEGPDMRDLVLNRANFLAKRPKKRPVDIALVVMQLLKDGVKTMAAKDFSTVLLNTGAPLDIGLIDEIVNAFTSDASASGKEKFVNIESLVDYAKRKWPERKLPPTPPPEPEPELPLETVPESTLPVKTKKGKKK